MQEELARIEGKIPKQGLPALEQVDDGVGERQGLGPPLDEKPRQVEQRPLKVLAPNFQVVDL